MFKLITAGCSPLILSALLSAMFITACGGSDDNGVGTSGDPSTSAGKTAGGPTESASFLSTAAEVANPERGLSKMLDISSSQVAFDAHYAAGYRIVTIRPSLTNYVNNALDGTILSALDAMAARIRTAGLKLAIGFSYENCGSDIVGLWGCPVQTWLNGHPTLTRITGHISQLSAWYKANADIIVANHGGFLGVYGEWAGADANNGQPGNNPQSTVYQYESVQGIWEPTDAAKLAVKDALLAAMDPRTPLAIRNFPSIMKWYPTPLAASQAFSGSAQSRVHHHSDCFMANKDDAGTYWVPGGLWNGQYVDTGVTTANPFRAYHAAAASYMSTGGEPCGSNERLGCDEILRDGPRYNWRYLRDDWGTDLWNSWQAGGCLAQVKRSLGYRFQLDQVSHPITAARGQSMTVNVDLRNVGWSRIFSARKLTVTLRHKASGATIDGTSTADTRTLAGQATSSTTVPVTLSISSNAAMGDYDVYVGLPDAFTTTASNARFAVRFANADDASKNQAWDASIGRFRTGTNLAVQ